MRAIVVGLCALLVLGTGPGFAQAQPMPQPSPQPEEKVSWEGWEWAVMMGAGFGGALAGATGSVAFYWSLGGCEDGVSWERCYEPNRPSSLAVGLVGGAPVGAALAVGLTGNALGYEGDIVWTWAGAMLGLIGFALPLSCLTCSPDSREALPTIGAAVAMFTVPATATLYYYITQPNPARIGERAGLLDFDPEEGWSPGVPVLLRSPDGQTWSVHLAGGRF